MVEKTYQVEDMTKMPELFGSFDFNIKLVESELDVQIINRGGDLKIMGAEDNVTAAYDAISAMMEILKNGEALTEQGIRYCITMAKEGSARAIASLKGDFVCITSKGKPIKAKTLGQKEYVKAIKDNPICFGIGPAGTGKTFLAVAMAVEAFRKKEVSRIILTRPAVEAGEKLGFLPGDLQMKVDPYLRPLYDAMYEMMGMEAYQKYVERGQIEVAPLAYMRGRTLDDAFIILDEAQNTTPEQMKMFLTRVGFGSRVIVTGDVTQIDLPDGKTSGLKEAIKILKNIEGIAFINLTEKDVVRHPLVQQIIKAYEKHEREKQAKIERNKK
ncbi:MAG: PhoH family protein [Bacillota bacterium]|nr:PhoH family protein [Bacillota bacterium]